MNHLSRRKFMGATAGMFGSTFFSHTSSGFAAENKSFQPEIRHQAAYDLVVCGGGPAGCAAALAARRNGLSVLLLDNQGQLGGMGTSGLVSHWLGGRKNDCKTWAAGGIFKMLATEAAAREIALLPAAEPAGKWSPHGWSGGQLNAGVPFDPFGMAAFLDEKILAAEIDVLLQTTAIDAVVRQQKISQIIISNKSGLAAVSAKLVVDATGDADVAARSGCEFVKGREADNLMAAATLQFHLYNVDQEALSEYIHQNKARRFREKIRQLRKIGEWPFPYDIFISAQLQEKGVFMINTSRLVGIDGTDGASVTDGLVRGRQETWKLLGILKKHFPGFANAKIKAVAPALGIRETRRIVGDLVLAVEDLNSEKNFPDTIGFSAYGWDLPNPKRPSDNPHHGHRLELTPIPYRVMLPRPIENLIVPGRAISVERPVLGPLRVMAPCMVMGEAAGEAAALALKNAATFAKVNTDELRENLRQHGAIVES